MSSTPTRIFSIGPTYTRRRLSASFSSTSFCALLSSSACETIFSGSCIFSSGKRETANHPPSPRREKRRSLTASNTGTSVSVFQHFVNMLLVIFPKKRAEPVCTSAKVHKILQFCSCGHFSAISHTSKRDCVRTRFRQSPQNIAVLLMRASQRKVRTLKAALPFRKKRLDSCDSIQ